MLGAVAVVHVEIDDGDARQPVGVQRMRRRHGDVVEQAKPHRLVAFGMVTGRADRAEDRPGLAAHHQIDAQHARARRALGGLQGAGGHHGIAVDLDGTRRGGHGEDAGQIVGVMHPPQLFAGDQGRVIVLHDEIQTRHDDLVVDRAQPFGGFRMQGARIVVQAVGVRDDGEHGDSFAQL